MLQLIVLLGLMAAAGAGGILTGYVAALVKDEPVRSKEEFEQKIFTNYLTGFAYYNDGSLIGQGSKGCALGGVQGQSPWA